MSLQGEVPLMERDVSGSGEPLVLVSGGSTGWIGWIPHAETLAASRRVIRLQLHNVAFGLSGARLPANYSVDFEVAGHHSVAIVAEPELCLIGRRLGIKPEAE